MPMLLVNTYVDVKNPKVVEAVLVYRQYNDGPDTWGENYTTITKRFNRADLEAARDYVNSFEIGEPQ